MNVLSPLRDVSNNGEYATPSPSAKGGKKSRMFGVSKDENASNPKASTRMKPSLGKTPAASASSMKTPALATSTTRATPMSTTQKENAKAAKRTLASHAKANAPLKLNDDALKTPNGVGRRAQQSQHAKRKSARTQQPAHLATSRRAIRRGASHREIRGRSQQARGGRRTTTQGDRRQRGAPFVKRQDDPPSEVCFFLFEFLFIFVWAID